MLNQANIRRALWTLGCVLAMLALGACGDDGGDDGVDGDAQANGTPQSTAIPRDPLPTVEGRTVTSVAKGYSVTYPDGWEPRYDLAVTPDQKLDAYFGPPRATADLFRASITVSCERIAGSEDSRAYFERKRAVTESTAVGEIIGPEPITLGGLPAFRIEYQLDAQDQDVRKIEIYAANRTCGYTIGLSSSPEELTQHLPAWREFLAAFRFL
jgi:hypothetical protein